MQNMKTLNFKHLTNYMTEESMELSANCDCMIIPPGLKGFSMVEYEAKSHSQVVHSSLLKDLRS